MSRVNMSPQVVRELVDAIEDAYWNSRLDRASATCRRRRRRDLAAAFRGLETLASHTGRGGGAPRPRLRACGPRRSRRCRFRSGDVSAAADRAGSRSGVSRPGSLSPPRAIAMRCSRVGCVSEGGNRRGRVGPREARREKLPNSPRPAAGSWVAWSARQSASASYAARDGVRERQEAQLEHDAARGPRRDRTPDREPAAAARRSRRETPDRNGERGANQRAPSTGARCRCGRARARPRRRPRDRRSGRRAACPRARRARRPGARRRPRSPASSGRGPPARPTGMPCPRVLAPLSTLARVAAPGRAADGCRARPDRRTLKDTRAPRGGEHGAPGIHHVRRSGAPSEQHDDQQPRHDDTASAAATAPDPVDASCRAQAVAPRHQGPARPNGSPTNQRAVKVSIAIDDAAADPADPERAGATAARAPRGRAQRDERRDKRQRPVDVEEPRVVGRSRARPPGRCRRASRSGSERPRRDRRAPAAPPAATQPRCANRPRRWRDARPHARRRHLRHPRTYTPSRP